MTDFDTAAPAADGAGGGVAAPGPDWSRWALFHSLLWLVLANAVGLWMATLLAWPSAGADFGALTYGRWAPLHMNGQLYGWCALPLVGLAYRWFRAPHATARSRADRWFVGGLHTWSGALALGALSWLAGLNSGKIFLEWHSVFRLALPFAIGVVWFALVLAAKEHGPMASARLRALHASALVVLAGVPVSLVWATGRSVYPAVNPDSGGATGTSLLGSTLGLVAVFGLAPLLLRVPRRPGSRVKIFWGAWVGSMVLFACVDHGDASHYATSQIVALAALMLWIPLGVYYFAAFRWQRPALRCLWAAWVWWTLLVISGWLTFLPGLSDQWKFTHVLVAHAHLAMAGFVTSFLLAVLTELTRDTQHGAISSVFPAGSFYTWQVCAASHVAILVAIGWNETESADLFLDAPFMQLLLALRWVAGAGMFAASVHWLIAAGRRLRPANTRVSILAITPDCRSGCSS